MDGFVVVELLSNTTYNGTEASLKVSEINNTYLIRSSDLENRWDIPTAFDPDYRPFYGLWAYILATSVLWVPAMAGAVLYMTKLWKDKFNDAQRNNNDGFELLPVRGESATPSPLIPYSGPAPEPATRQQAPKPASQAQIIIVVGFLLIWRFIGLAFPIHRIVFVAKQLPWIRSRELGECMIGRMGSLTPTVWAWCIIVPAVYVSLFHTVLMVFRIWVAIATMTRRKMWLFDPFNKNNQITLLWVKIIFCASVEILVFVFVLEGHDFNFCADVGRKRDLHELMLSYVFGIVWIIIDRASRPFLRRWLTAFGFPRFPSTSQDALGTEGPISEASGTQRSTSSGTVSS